VAGNKEKLADKHMIEISVVSDQERSCCATDRNRVLQIDLQALLADNEFIMD